MATKKFNVDIVLDKVIMLFWRHGYAATSMQQIVRATGLKPGSIYHEFGSKEALFKLALSRYAEQSITATTNQLSAHSCVLDGIKAILNSLIEEAKSANYCGCFLIKSQLELSASNNSIYLSCIEQLRQIEVNYASALQQRFDRSTALLYAQQLMLVIFGIRVYSYQSNEEQSLYKNYQLLLPWLF